MVAKIKYKTLNDFGFQSLIQKLANAQTSTTNASHIRRIVNLVQKASDQMREDFKKDVLELYAARDEEGKIIATKEKPFDIPDDKIEAFTAATEVFGEREGTVDWRPLNAHTIQDLKVSAREMELLGDLYTEEGNGPGLPEFAEDAKGVVHSLRK